MWRFDEDDPIISAILIGSIVAVETKGTPIEMLRFTFSDSRRVVIVAMDGELVIEEEDLPQA